MTNVKLIAITQPLLTRDGDEIIDYGKQSTMTIDEFIAFVARVSNPSNQNNTLTAKKLLKYLIKHKHWSPFEMVNIVVEINTTRDIGRQILRHRSFSFQEFSQRYADPNQLGFVKRETRLQDNKNRQNSIELDCSVYKDAKLVADFKQKQNEVMGYCDRTYKWAIENGIAKEVARAVLPEGLTMSRMYMNGTLRSWIHYCQLRMAEGTQKEHREIAKEAWKLIIELFPSLEEVII